MVRALGILRANGLGQLVTWLKIVLNGVDAFSLYNLPYPLNPHVPACYYSFSLTLVLVIVLSNLCFSSLLSSFVCYLECANSNCCTSRAKSYVETRQSHNIYRDVMTSREGQ